MTQRTINLYDGLEALYYLDSDYYDGTANEIKDKSGYGRHAEASGGPTVGVEGPNNFQATSFDGSDDYFATGKTLGYDEQTTLLIFKPDNTDGTNKYICSNEDSNNFDDGFWVRFADGQIEYSLRDGSGNQAQADVSASADIWYVVLAMWDGSDIYNIVNGTVGATDSVSTHTQGTSDFEIGAYNSTDVFAGDIAAVARWSRALSNVEIQHLNRLTAPRRAML